MNDRDTGNGCIFPHMTDIWAGLRDGGMFSFCCAGIECIHGNRLVNTSQADDTNYHPSQVEFLGVGSNLRVVHLLTYIMDCNVVSPEEKQDGGIWF